jgi:hypothetical protein
MSSRVLAAGAAVLGTVCGVLVALVVAPVGIAGYVSENGVPGSPHATVYRIGVLGVAVTAALLAIALRRSQVLVALPLAVAAPAIMMSAEVTCTPGCPLPPHAPTTAADLIHAIASFLGVGLFALAMLASAWRGSTVSRIAVLTGWPLLAGTAIGVVAIGRGTVTGVLERLALTVCVGWLVTFAALHAVAPSPRAPRVRIPDIWAAAARSGVAARDGIALKRTDITGATGRRQ